MEEPVDQGESRESAFNFEVFWRGFKWIVCDLAKNPPQTKEKVLEVKDRIGREFSRVFGCGRRAGYDQCASKKISEVVKQLQKRNKFTGDVPADATAIEADAVRQDFVWLLKSMPYEEYLRTAHWKELREQVLQRASNQCEICRDTRNLKVHHKTYERRGHERLADLMLLCDKCHKMVHNKG